MEFGFAFIGLSFLAGLLTFLAPCTLPLVPAYLGFISGVDPRELENPETARQARKKIFLNGLFFIVGFSLVFIVFGTLFGLVGQKLVTLQIWLTRIAGLFVVIFGLYMIGLLKLNFLARGGGGLKIPKWIKAGNPISSFGVGSAFAFGWTPCVGPILGSILLLASTSSTALQGAFLLAVFSLGLAVPFLALAVAFSKMTHYIQRISRYLEWISKIGGVILLVFGVLLMLDQFGLVIQYGFRLLEFINYESLLDYL